MKIFISYSSGDRGLVTQLEEDLTKLEHNVWFDQQLTGGSNWWKEILDQIENCDLFIFAMTPNSVDSDACNLEVKYAASLNKRILPVMLAETNTNTLSPELSQIQHVNSVELGRDSLIKLLKAFDKLPPAKPLPKPLPERPDAPQSKTDCSPVILIVGSGSGEKVLKFDTELNLGRKQSVSDHQELYGGSGVNYSLRLGAAGFDVLPVLSIGPDWIGRRIQEKLKVVSKQDQILDFVGNDDFLCDRLTTPESTVLVVDGRRTIFTGHLRGFEHFKGFVQRQLAQVDALDRLDIKAVMIGHIYSDSSILSPGEEGQITRNIIDCYADRGVMVFTNLGRSQYELGSTFWQDSIQKVSIFQLALDEARTFFQDAAIQSVRGMIEWFQERGITAIITMDKMGALATLKDGKHGVFFARPYDLGGRLVDSTGAGDAFGAGLVAYFFDKVHESEKSRRKAGKEVTLDQIFTRGNFQDAIEQARNWAAYCCTTLGAANICPDRDALEEFTASLGSQTSAMIKNESLNDLDDTMWLIDKAYY